MNPSPSVPVESRLLDFRFLNYTTERIFLQKVDGGYIFIHRLLLEHFEAMYETIQTGGTQK